MEREGRMNTEEVVVKQVAPVRLAEISAMAASYESEQIGPVIQPLYRELFPRLEKAGVTPSGYGIAYYEQAADGTVVVHAGVEVTAPASERHDFAIVDLPAIETAATIVHRGPMDGVDSTYQLLAHWVEEQGYRSLGLAREVTLECPCDDPDGWVTELQLAVTTA